MKKIIYLLFLLSASNLFAQEYLVQVAAFNQAVESNYFSSRGLNNVYLQPSANFYRYVSGPYNSESAAQAARNEAAALGFNAYVMNMTAIRETCASACVPQTMSLEEKLKVRNIFFDFDRSDLRGESRHELDILTRILNENPNYFVEVHAYTDAKGTNTYNEALSERRRNSVINYLKNHGIDGSRIKSFAHGEESPVAKNEINGTDSPEGRQYNRRVELKVKDGSGLIDVVEDINVPDYLRK
ncbi:MAG: OmpA family protein [Chitinophagales bacterium]|nr:OmpA family protein [Bacteroidota bacterium]MCB9042340.1 OmpA family protein [Chitinophagales bacterium]